MIRIKMKWPGKSIQTALKSAVQDMLKCLMLLSKKCHCFWHCAKLFCFIHVMAGVLTYLAVLFQIKNFSTTTLPLRSLFLVWNRWDTGQFTDIANKAYQGAWQTAFFPLYPLLEAALSHAFHISAFAAGLLIANVSYFVVLYVLYKLADELHASGNENVSEYAAKGKETGKTNAARVVFTFACYPTAFFLIAAYNESLFLMLVLLYFYFCKKNGWYSSLFGFLAALTRSAGLILCIVELFVMWQERRLRTTILAIPLGVAVFSAYCYFRFGDALAFSHAQSVWHRQLSWPWQGVYNTWLIITAGGVLRFDAIHGIIDMSAVLLQIAMTFVVSTRKSAIPKQYTVYSTALLLFLLCFPAYDRAPLQSFSRLSLELFPVFFVFGRVKAPYLLVAFCMLYTLLLLQFLTGGWMV